MTWDDVLKIAAAVFAGVGGISGIIILAVKFASNIIAKRLEERYTLRLNKELEEYKSTLENKNYISNVRFDREFEMYQELSEKTSKEAIETKQKVLSNLSDAIIKDMRNYLNHLVVIGG